MAFVAAAKNTMLDAEGTAIGFLGVATAFSSTGTNEATGGSPAYARKAATWSAASGGSKALTTTLPVFDLPAGTYKFYQFWTLVTSGVFHGQAPIGSTGYKPVETDLAGDFVLSEAHGFSNGDQVVFIGGTPPTGTGIAEGTVLFVVGSATDKFQVATTSGGTAIDLTVHGDTQVRVSKIVPEVFNGQGTLTVSSLTLSL